MTLCCDWTIVKAEKRLRTAEPLYCRSWTCEVCHPRRCRELKRLAFRGKGTKFLTLTVDPKFYGSPAERAQRLSHAWKTFLKRYRRWRPRDVIAYLCVFEETINGEPHLHILLRARFIPQWWISSVMNELIGAPIVYIKRVDKQKKYANYIAKYIGKQPERFPGTKRYWTSQNWLEPWEEELAERDEPRPDFWVFRGSRLEWMANEGAMGFLAFGSEERAFSKHPGERSSKPPDAQALGARP